MLSLGILFSRAFCKANFKRILPVGSAPPMRAATVISRPIFVANLAFNASVLPFLCLIFAHLECPDIDASYLFHHASPRSRSKMIDTALRTDK